MIIKQLIDEDFINYKKPSMFITFPSCTFKCEKECGLSICQNSRLYQSCNININTKQIVVRYINNNLTNAIVCGGLEPFDSYNDLKCLIADLRQVTQDDIVIYTGYNKNEILDKIQDLKGIPNIIIKFGRFIPNQQKHYDDILGVYLASDNQYAERISDD